MRRHYTVVLCFFAVFIGTAAAQTVRTSKQAFGMKGLAVTAHPLATQTAVEILQKGGSAVDATIAAQLVLAVVYPRAGNIGGGGFMVYREANGKAFSLDYREKAPAAASRDMYLDSSSRPARRSSIYGAMASGVPGTVAGLVAAHQQFGKLPWRRLIEPAIGFAEKGYALTRAEAGSLNKYKKDFATYAPSSVFATAKEWKEGDRVVQRDLAATLRRIQRSGKAGFYEGETANLLVAEMQRGGGIISKRDLRDYEAKWRTPLIGRYKNYMLVGMPPPSSGGIALLQMLRMLERVPLSRYGFQSPEAVHIITEVERRAYADRSEYLGDPDFWKVPLRALLDTAYLRRRMADFNPNRATPSAAVKAGSIAVAEHEQTTHLSIVDEAGNAVSVTTTLNGNYGSKVVVKGAGFIMNNEMDDFSAKPGSPNMFGLIGGAANAIAPGKRMLSSMTPTIIVRDNRLFMVLGSPGGSTIITSVLQVFLNVAEFGLPLKDAVFRPRFHHQWLPDKLYVEDGGFSRVLTDALVRMGHKVEERETIGRIEAILIDANGRREGVADNRGDDAAAAQ